MSDHAPFFFDPKKLNALAERYRDQYVNADPCPHIYFDDFLPIEAAEDVLAEFPGAGVITWKNIGNEHEIKKSCENEQHIGPMARHLIAQFNSSAFVTFLEKLTGIDGLITDSHLRGGGLHRIEKGGYLKVHLDFNWYPKLRLTRRLNILFFLNKDWKEEYGGHFELWDKDMKKAQARILPVFYRLALFATSEESYHGHPDPLNCLEGMARKSIALYYYTSNGTEEVQKYSTVFRPRPGEDFLRGGSFSKNLIRELMPPIIYKNVKKILGKK